MSEVNVKKKLFKMCPLVFLERLRGRCLALITLIIHFLLIQLLDFYF